MVNFCKKKFRGTRVRIFFVLLVIFLLLLLSLRPKQDLFSKINHKVESMTNLFKTKEQIVKQISNSTDDEPFCLHPKLPLWHPSMNKFFQRPIPIDCHNEKKNLVYSKSGKFYKSNNSAYGNFTCDFMPMIREDDMTSHFGDAIKDIKSGDPMPNDFGKVVCQSQNGKETYTQLLSGIHREEAEQKALKSDLNILMFAFDSTSRLMWMRNLPKTHDFFVNKLGGVVMEGYNIVGDGTARALIPLLTGFNETDLPEARKGFDGADYVDGHPFIWKGLKKRGYMTQYIEDRTEYGTTFNYRMMGFKEQPVHHYFLNFDRVLMKTLGKKYPFCFGSLKIHDLIFNYIKDLYAVYPDRPKFTFLIHGAYTHDYTTQVREADDDVRNLLEEFLVSGYLDNTLLVMFADHGGRYSSTSNGGFRLTTQGKYEERMPYMGLLFPKKFQQKYPEKMVNLHRNAHRLTTPYDLHATLLDLIDSKSDKEYGISLLKEIPKERTCEDVRIQPHWCACMSWKAIDTESKDAQNVVQYFISELNKILQPKRDICQKLEVSQIFSMEKSKPNEKVLQFQNSINARVPVFGKQSSLLVFYQIDVETKPGGGRFETTVKCDIASDGKTTYEMNIKDISRINQYGDQSHCVKEKDPHLAKLCYCIRQL